MTLAQDNMTTSRRLIEHAEWELRNGEPLQASEKAWGAVVHNLKAIARERGWPHGGHYQLSQIVDRLAAESDDDEIRALFSIAEALHVNFYNNWKTASAVRSNVESVKRLLDKLSAIYENGG